MNKNELVKAISQKANVTKEIAQRTLGATTDIITDTLRNDETVTLIGFGSFHIRKRSERDGHNPRTGERMKIRASKSPVFKPGKLLKDAVK